VKILIVDDDDLNIEILKEMLEGNEYNVIVANDGVEALSAVLKNPDIRIILLDRMMPKMDGMQFMKMFGDHPNSANVAVIFQTAANQPRDVVDGLSTGAFYYLTKPFDKDMVLSVIHAALQELNERGVNIA
jgi:CheY-like chemotaxis protein